MPNIAPRNNKKYPMHTKMGTNCMVIPSYLLVITTIIFSTYLFGTKSR